MLEKFIREKKIGKVKIFNAEEIQRTIREIDGLNQDKCGSINHKQTGDGRQCKKTGRVEHERAQPMKPDREHEKTQPIHRKKHAANSNQPNNITVNSNQPNSIPTKSQETFLTQTQETFIAQTEYTPIAQTEYTSITQTDYIPITQAGYIPITQAENTPATFPSNEERKKRILNAFSPEIPYSKITFSMYLPACLKHLCKLFRILETAYRFNQTRGVELIFDVHRKSIERLFGSRLDICLLEQLKYILGSRIQFTKVIILQEGKSKGSFNIKTQSGREIEEEFYGYYRDEYSKFLKRERIVGKVMRIHPDFEIESIPRMPLFEDDRVDGDLTEERTSGNLTEERTSDNSIEERACSDTNKGIDKSAVEIKVKREAKDIYERIREKERQRKEQFIKEEVKKVDYQKKMESVFNLVGKKAIRLEDMVNKMGIKMRGREILMDACGSLFTIKKINGEEYVVKINGEEYVVNTSV